ncbi:MAG: DNA internalization-related competence protein ComEC/Rec2, partial [Rhodocyclaceae bacterium]|nr:DNA internalization-related competence protein ComEC/Rec2 [Rhodocyclaceae bacterium]
TGPAWPGGRDAGQNVLLPYFAAQGIRRLDALVLSHDDRDHTGGAATLLDAMRVARIDASFAPPNAAQHPCLAGTHWDWDGVRFEYLSPHSEATAHAAHDNDRSCLLRIRAADGTALLLTGDIGEAFETALLAQGADFSADFVQAAHHGSAHSSSPAFVAATGARHVLISAGFHNTFGHPAEATLARWRARGAHIWRTDEEGAITFDLSQNATITTERRTHPRYWRAAPPNTPAD